MKCLLRIWQCNPEATVKEATYYKTKKDAEAAIDKKIKECEEKGYKIRGSKKKGYSIYTSDTEKYIYEIVKA